MYNQCIYEDGDGHRCVLKEGHGMGHDCYHQQITSQYVPCEHLKERVGGLEPGLTLGHDPLWKRVYLADNKTALLCEFCYKALAYDVITQYNRDSQRFQPYTIERR